MDVCSCAACLTLGLFYSQTEHLVLTLGLWTRVREGQQMGEGQMERGEEGDKAKYVTVVGTESSASAHDFFLFLKVQKLKHIISLSS